MVNFYKKNLITIKQIIKIIINFNVIKMDIKINILKIINNKNI